MSRTRSYSDSPLAFVAGKSIVTFRRNVTRGTALFAMALVALLSLSYGEEVGDFGQLNRLPKDAAARGSTAKIQCTVLCYDAGWGQLYFYDGTEARWISPLMFQRSFEPGDVVELSGVVQITDGVPGLTNLTAKVIDNRKLPAARRHRLQDLAADFGQWVEVTGQVRVADTSWGRLALVLEEQGQSCLVYVMGTPAVENSRHWVGARVTMRGINGSNLQNGRLVRAILFAPDLREVKLLQPSKMHVDEIPRSAIDTLLNMELGSWTNEMVRINGVILSYKPGSSIEVRDPTGSMTAEVIQMTRALPEQTVDVWGYPAITEDGFVLRNSYFELATTPAQSNNLEVSAAPLPSAMLTNASAVAGLSRQTAANNLPVELTGIVTYSDPEWHSLFLQDGNCGIYVDSAQTNVTAGQRVRLKGKTSSGGYMPEIKAATIEILGTTNLPQAASVDVTDLSNGHLDGQWVELEGVVRRARHEWNHLHLNVTMPKGRFKVVVPNVTNPHAAVGLVDCVVKVRGACGSQLNTRGQLSGITLHAPSLSQVEVVDRVPVDPFRIRTSSIRSLAQFDPQRRAGRRIRLNGIVGMTLPRGGFYLQDATGGIRVETQGTNDLQAGEMVDVLGFTVIGDFSPYVEEAIWRRSDSTGLPEPKRLTSGQIIATGVGDSELVELDARLVQDVVHSAKPKLVLQEGNVLFTASLMKSAWDPNFDKWKAGSVLRLKGICSIQGDDDHEPQGFKLLVADPHDVVLLKAASRFNTRQVLTMIGVLIIGIGAAVAWIVLLRRQVHAQTNALRLKQQELLQLSRQAGMAEVATSVLHNVGNVLNSINVSATLVHNAVETSRTADLKYLDTLLSEQAGELAKFFKEDPRASKIPEFVTQLSRRLSEERASALSELASLRKNVEHVNEIVAMQQSYAKVSGMVEVIDPTELVEDSLRVNAQTLNRHGIRVTRVYSPVPRISTDKHKLLQILNNLISNAKNASKESNCADRQITVRVSPADDRIRIAVIDNGIGILSENLTKIFNHGFTTRRAGHGFGLHSSALAAKELGGHLAAQSRGPGHGATFTLDLPMQLPGQNS